MTCAARASAPLPAGGPLGPGECLRELEVNRALRELLQEHTHCDVSVYLNLERGWPARDAPGTQTRRMAYVYDETHELVFQADAGRDGRFVLVDTRSARVDTRTLESSGGRLTVKLRERCTPSPAPVWRALVRDMGVRGGDEVVEAVRRHGLSAKLALDREVGGVVYRTASVFRLGARATSYTATYQSMSVRPA